MNLPPARRTVLAALAATGGLGALTACSTSKPPKQSVRGRAVLVVGAGAAGLSAARTLANAGATVTVLEARDRLGGRVHTSHVWPDVPIDLGASWIHGSRGNPVTALAKEAGVATLATSYDSAELHVASPLRSQGLTDSHTDRWDDFTAQALAGVATGDQDVSIGTALERAPGWGALTSTERADLDFYLTATYGTEWGADVRELSAWTIDDGKAFGGADLLLPSGYGRVFEPVAHGLSLRTQTPVTQVRAMSTGVAVTTPQGELTADAVVVTVPLGVLKAGGITCEPGLSEAAQVAVERVGVGVLSKTFLRFEETFWPADVDWHEYLGTSGGWSQWVSLAKAGPPVLIGFNAADRGRDVESADEGAVTAAALAVLRDMFGPVVPEPIAAVTSAWSTDPWAHGSYSFNAVGATREDRLALAAPIEQRIFWAGEHTDPDYYGTVHGAVLSGRRAAAEVMTALANGRRA